MARVGRTLLSAALDSPGFLGRPCRSSKTRGKKRVPQVSCLSRLGILCPTPQTRPARAVPCTFFGPPTRLRVVPRGSVPSVPELPSKREPVPQGGWPNLNVFCRGGDSCCRRKKNVTSDLAVPPPLQKTQRWVSQPLGPPPTLSSRPEQIIAKR